MTARYALYIAPPADTPLWRFGSKVIGYDAALQEDVNGFALSDIGPEAWRELTRAPRTYGFHATLKAPFRLAEGRTAEELSETLRLFCASRSRFDLGPLGVTVLPQGEGGFVALTQQRHSADLEALESSIVRDLDSFRAPLSAPELARRRPEALSERQLLNLMEYGYPYIGQDYRFHLTLTGWMASPATVADALADAYAREIGGSHFIIDAVTLFEQVEPNARFRIAGRFPLPGL